MLGHRTLTVEDYITILKRRWWILAIPAIIFPIVGLGITFFVTPQYTSQTLVIINQQKVPSDFVKPVVSEDLNSRLASMREQIMSRASLEPIIRKYNLYDASRADMDARIAMARKNIEIQPIQSVISSSGLPGFKIFFTASDPQTAQQVCQEITSLFTDANVKIRSDTARQTTTFMKEQLDQQKANLDEQDAKLAAFKRQYAGMLPEDTQSSMGVLSSLQSRLDAITGQIQNDQQNKTMAEAQLGSQQQMLDAMPAGDTRGPGALEHELETLQGQEADLSLHYQDEYPALKRVRSRIAELQKQMAQEASAPPKPVAASKTSRPEPESMQALRMRIKLLDSDMAAKRKQQEEVDQQIRGYQAKIQSTPQIEEQEKELTRDYQTTLEAYTSTKQKLDQSQMATDLEQRQQGETFNLLDAANLPESPTFPNRGVFIGGGLMVGLAIGLMIIALLEYKDTALRSERDIWAFTQLPTLAVIAWSDQAQEGGSQSRFARLFRRKQTSNQLMDAPG
jgi:polysaccharide chain length determinant protein (PEP-CTERM system associated)